MIAYAIVQTGRIVRQESGWLDIFDSREVAEDCTIEGEETVEVEITPVGDKNALL